MVRLSDLVQTDLAFISDNRECAQPSYNMRCPELPGQKNMFIAACIARTGKDDPCYRKNCGMGAKVRAAAGLPAVVYVKTEVDLKTLKGQERRNERRKRVRDCSAEYLRRKLREMERGM
jgi:hypothetical protein